MICRKIESSISFYFHFIFKHYNYYSYLKNPIPPEQRWDLVYSYLRASTGFAVADRIA